MRDLSVTYLRVIAMMMVVLYHLLCPYTKIWESWGMVSDIYLYRYIASVLNAIDMPIFVFLSGFLYMKGLENGKYEDVFSIIKAKTMRLLIPFVVWGIFSILVLHYSLDTIHKGIGHLWFLLMLYGQFILFHITRNIWIKKTINNEILLLLMLIFLNVCCVWIKNPDLWVLRQMLFYGYTFYWGILCAKNNQMINTLLNFKIFFLCLVLLFIIVKFKNLAPILPFVVIFLTALSLKWLMNKKLQNNFIIKSLDRMSMGIYIIHHLILRAIMPLTFVKLLFADYIWMPFVMLPFLIMVSAIICYMIKIIPYGKYFIG